MIHRAIRNTELNCFVDYHSYMYIHITFLLVLCRGYFGFSQYEHYVKWKLAQQSASGTENMICMYVMFAHTFIDCEADYLMDKIRCTCTFIINPGNAGS